MIGLPTFRERQVRYMAEKEREAKELIRKVLSLAPPAVPGEPFEPRRSGAQVELERPAADYHFRRQRRQPTTVRRCQAAHNRDYRWSSTPDADRCAVFGTRLGQGPSEPRDLADRLRPAAILQLPDTRRA
jgi:hypothetical protein